LTRTTVFDQTHYPGVVGRVIVVNSPWIMPVFFNLIKGFLGADIQSRIQIIGDAKTELPKLIPAEHLPTEWGGSKKSYDEIVPIKDAAGLLIDEDEGLDAKNIAAGSAFNKEFSCDAKGGVFTWYFQSVGEYDVDFSARLITPDGKTTTIKHASRCTTSKGAYTSDGEARVVFTWDNSYSWLNSKDIRYFVSVVDKPVLSESKKP